MQASAVLSWYDEYVIQVGTFDSWYPKCEEVHLLLVKQMHIQLLRWVTFGLAHGRLN